MSAARRTIRRLLTKLSGGHPRPTAEDSAEARELAIRTLQDAESEHLAKLKQEQRTCESCGYLILNPLTDRCPRCFSMVPPSQHTNCGECDYKGNCALAELKPKGG